MQTVLGGYIDLGEMPALVALVSRGEAAHVEVLGALSFGGSPMQRDSIFRIASITNPLPPRAQEGRQLGEGRSRLPLAGNQPTKPIAPLVGLRGRRG